MSPAVSSSAPPRATVAAGFVTGMLAGALRHGHDPQPWLLASGIAPELLALAAQGRAPRIPVERYAQLYNTVNVALDDEGFALFSRPMPVGSFELLCRSLTSAPHLREALERASRYLRILLPDIALRLSQQGNTACLQLVEVLPLANESNAPARVFAFEWLLRLLHGLSSWLVGRGLALESVTFPYARPAHAEDYQLIYTAHSYFCPEQTALEARFPADLLDLPLRRDEAAVTSFLAGAPGKITTLYRRDREMVLRVRDQLRAALPELPALEQVALSLHLSERTLERRLAAEGSSFRAIKDALRRDVAVARLLKTEESIQKIATDLGYAELSAFYRAFVDWTGKTPAAYRRHAQGR